MDRQEFIDKLRAALNSSLSPSLVMDHVNYYQDYIQSEMRKGRSEQDVLASLGDPRLIARTIIQTNTTEEDGYQSGGYGGNTYQGNGYDQYSGNYDSGNSGQSGYYSNGYGAGGYQQARTSYRGEVERHVKIPGWVWGLVVILVLVLIIGVIMSVLSFLAPVLIPIIVVLFLVKLFRDWLN